MDIKELSEQLGVAEHHISESAWRLVNILKEIETDINLSKMPDDVLKKVYKLIACELAEREKAKDNEVLDRICKLMKNIEIYPTDFDVYYSVSDMDKQECYKKLFEIQKLLVEYRTSKLDG